MKILQILVVVFLLGTTSVTLGALAFYQTNPFVKDDTTQQSVDSKLAGTQGSAEQPLVSSPDIPQSSTPSSETQPASTPVVSQVKPVAPVVTPTPAPAPTPTPTPPPSPKPQGCIVTIDGISYDVTVFRKSHSGGDVFKCGTDMTKIFYSQHSQKMLQLMQKYKI